MSVEREAILARIRQALGRAVLPQAGATLPPRPAPSPAEPLSLVESFSRELRSVGGEVYQPATLEAARAQVIQLVKESGGGEVLAWADLELPLPGLGPALAAAGLQRLLVRLSADPAERRQQMADLDRPLTGLTGALAGLADTGSLALQSGPDRPRAASLLPLVHVALLPIRRLYPSLAGFLAAHPGLTAAASNLVLITGPSRTADIEMVITRGVHGPRNLRVVLLPDA